MDNKKKLLLKVTIGDLAYLRDKGYLSNKGKEWLEYLIEIDLDYSTGVECEQ